MLFILPIPPSLILPAYIKIYWFFYVFRVKIDFSVNPVLPWNYEPSESRNSKIPPLKSFVFDLIIVSSLTQICQG